MIHLSNITKQHGSQVLFRDAGFQILPGSRNGLVGPNGSGKTTIFRIIIGEEEVDSGDIFCVRWWTGFLKLTTERCGYLRGTTAITWKRPGATRPPLPERVRIAHFFPSSAGLKSSSHHQSEKRFHAFLYFNRINDAERAGDSLECSKAFGMVFFPDAPAGFGPLGKTHH